MKKIIAVGLLLIAGVSWTIDKILNDSDKDNPETATEEMADAIQQARAKKQATEKRKEMDFLRGLSPETDC
jgi:hypothetical protein